MFKKTRQNKEPLGQNIFVANFFEFWSLVMGCLAENQKPPTFKKVHSSKRQKYDLTSFLKIPQIHTLVILQH